MPQAIPIVAAAVAGGASVYASKKAAKAQNKALAQAEQQAQTDARQRDIEFNAANQKKPQLIDSLIQKNLRESGGAQGGTLLTGPGGVTDPLKLGRSTLLGS